MKIKPEKKFRIRNRCIAKAVRAAGTIAATTVFAAVIVISPLSMDGPPLAYNSALAVGNGNGGVGQGNGRGAANGSIGGETASKMGSLNAARADSKAFFNASANSTIGKLAEAYGELAAYSDAVAALDALQAEFDALSEADKTGPVGDALLADIASAENDVTTALGEANDALMDAANKDGQIDADVVNAVAGLMAGKLD